MKIAIGGQIAKPEIEAAVRELAGDRVEIVVMGDVDAAMAVKNGEADYYLGACNTGGGGALSMAIAILGYGNCATVSMPGNIKSDEDIIAEVQNGKKAFGFTPEHIGKVVPVIMTALLE